MRKRVLILFTACCVMLAGAAEFRWDFSRSGDGCRPIGPDPALAARAEAAHGRYRRLYAALKPLFSDEVLD